MRTTLLLLTIVVASLTGTLAGSVSPRGKAKVKYECDWKLFSDKDDPGFCIYSDAPADLTGEDRQVPCKGGSGACHSEYHWCTFKIDKKTKKAIGKADCGLEK